MTAAPAITALAPWFGGKRTLAPRIVAELGDHRVYWEPFCGSMAVLLVKPSCVMETVNDLNGDLVNLARVVQCPRLAPALYRRLRRVITSKALLDEAAAACKERGRVPATSRPDIDRAFEYFTTSWLGRNGVAGTSSYNQGFSRRFTANGGHAAKRWDSAVSSIPQWRRRIRNVTVLNDDAFGLIERIDDAEGLAIYCDPPYVVKGARYIHDFAEGDHERLAGLLGRFRSARVVVSYYEHPEVRRLYRGWTFVSCPVAKALVSQAKRSKGNDVTAPEVLIINGPSHTAGGLFGGAH